MYRKAILLAIALAAACVASAASYAAATGPNKSLEGSPASKKGFKQVKVLDPFTLKVKVVDAPSASQTVSNNSALAAVTVNAVRPPFRPPPRSPFRPPTR